MNKQYEFSPIIEDVGILYWGQRKSGKSRAEAIDHIKTAYREALQDEDDRVAVLIGLALALCKKKELTNEILNEVLNEISYIKDSYTPSTSCFQYLANIEKILSQSSFLGDEAIYRRKHSYVPDWEIGDTFSHVLTHPMAQRVGVEGWTVLFCKIGEYIDDMQRSCQLVYVFLSPPEKYPTTATELQNLGFLRMMNHGDKWDYLAQLSFKSKKDEATYGLVKIGNFPAIIPPIDRTEETPMLTMPLWGLLTKNDTLPDYEEHVCILYKQNGVGINVSD